MVEREGSGLEPRELAVLAAEAAAEKKAGDIVAIEVGDLLVVTDYFVLATGNTDRQVRVIAEEVEKRLKEAGSRPVGREGEQEAKWLLLDFGDVVVHVFQPEERDFYRLERLWGEAPRLPLPESVTGPAGVSEDGGPKTRPLTGTPAERGAARAEQRASAGRETE